MKSKTSCFNKTVFKKNITHFWPVWLLVLAWNLFILPFMIFDNYLYHGDLSYLTAERLANEKINEIVNCIRIYMEPGMLFIFSVLVVMAVFSYLYTARSAYAIHALPVTRKELFLTNYVSGLLFLIVPEVIGFLLGTIVSAACGYTSLNYLLEGMFCAVGTSFFLYSFTVFIAMFTGQLVAVPIFSLILNFLYIGFRMILAELSGSISYGMTGDYQSSSFDILSPLFYLSDKVGVSFDYSKEYAVCKGITGTEVVAGYAAAGVVFVAAAFLVYRKKQMETAGSLIAVSWIAPVFRWGVACCGAMLFAILGCQIFRNSFLAALISAILFGGIFFFGSQMLLEKGFKVFKKKRLLECGAFLALLAVVFLSVEFDLFGQEKRVPKAENVERAYVDGMFLVSGDDAEQIKEIMEVHRQIIASKKEFERRAKADVSGEEIRYVRIKYVLKNGSVMQRSYCVPLTEEGTKQTNEVYGRLVDMMVQPEVYLKEMFGIGYENNKLQGSYLDLYDDDTQSHNYQFSDEDTEKLYQALLADLEAGTISDMLRRQWSGTDEEYEAYEEDTYYNSISFDFFNKDGVVQSYDVYQDTVQSYDGTISSYFRTYSQSSGASVTFDKNCKNIIQALKDTGAIQSEDDLVSIREMNRRQEETE